MKLTKKEIEHIAKLSRLDLTDKELGLYGGQLSDVLGYIDQLNEVDTTDVAPSAQVTGLKNIWREDEIETWPEDEVNDSLKEAPGMKNNHLKVKRVIK